MASELAQKATNKTKRTWQEIVPEQYHRHGKVFSEEASEQFPDWRPWDYAIDLKEDTPGSINCCVYPLLPKEKEEQREFLSQNLCLKHICRSKSPYASGFFLIRKKDGKFQPVQDYRNLNKWTIPNKYPLPLISELIYDLAEKRLFSKFVFAGATTTFALKKVMNTKPPSKQAKDYLSQQSHFLASQIPQQHFRQW